MEPTGYPPGIVAAWFFVGNLIIRPTDRAIPHKLVALGLCRDSLADLSRVRLGQAGFIL